MRSPPFSRSPRTSPRTSSWDRTSRLAHDTVGMILQETGDTAAALDHYRSGQQLLDALLARTRPTRRSVARLSVAHEHMGSLLLQQKDFEHALTNNRRALALRSALAAEFPLNADYRRTLLVSYYNDGEILAAMGRTRDALASYQKNLAIAEELLATDRDNEQYRGDLGVRADPCRGHACHDRTIAGAGQLPSLADAALGGCQERSQQLVEAQFAHRGRREDGRRPGPGRAARRRVGGLLGSALDDGSHDGRAHQCADSSVFRDDLRRPRRGAGGDGWQFRTLAGGADMRAGARRGRCTGGAWRSGAIYRIAGSSTASTRTESRP